MTVLEAQKKLQRALRRLRPDQGERARRNARAAVATSLRALRNAVAEEFPSLTTRKAPARLSSKLTSHQRAVILDRRLRARGLVPLAEAQADPALLAAAGIRVVFRKAEVAGRRAYAPAWVRGFGTLADLKRAKTDVRWRESRLAAKDAQAAHPVAP